MIKILLLRKEIYKKVGLTILYITYVCAHTFIHIEITFLCFIWICIWVYFSYLNTLYNPFPYCTQG